MNPILQLAESIKNATNRLCEVGPGPYGFGVHTEGNSEICLVLSFSPDPVTDYVIFSDTIDDYEVKVKGYHRAEGEPVSPEEIAAYAASEQANSATRLVAGAILALGKEPIRVTTEECNEAFDLMAKDWDYDRKGVTKGEYFINNFEAAKKDFAVRSGLFAGNRLFTDEQLAEVYRCIQEELDSGYEITEDRRTKLQDAAKQIEYAVPNLDELVMQSNEMELAL